MENNENIIIDAGTDEGLKEVSGVNFKKGLIAVAVVGAVVTAGVILGKKLINRKRAKRLSAEESLEESKNVVYTQSEDEVE